METSIFRSKYRNVPGGLDHAVQQAEQRGLHDWFIVDADCHQAEAISLFSKYLPEKWKQEYSDQDLKRMGAYEQAHKKLGANPSDPLDEDKVRLMMLYEELKDVAPFDREMKGRIIRSEGSYTSENYHELKEEEVVDLYTIRMGDIGIKRSIVFPETVLEFCNLADVNFDVALANAYIDYMLDRFLGKYPQFLSCVYAPARAPDKAAELIDRVGSEKGIVGVLIPPTTPGPLAGDMSWNPIYEAADRKGLPICFHANVNTRHPFDRFKKSSYLPVHTLSFPWYLILQLVSIISEGVVERFPNLKFVFIEGGITWIPWMMYRMDSEYLMRKSEAPLLNKLPSEYIKQFYFTSQPLERPRDIHDLKWVFDRFNAGTQLMYASDYPHWDFDVPKVIYDIPFLTVEDKRRILGENARQLFKIN